MGLSIGNRPRVERYLFYSLLRATRVEEFICKMMRRVAAIAAQYTRHLPPPVHRATSVVRDPNIRRRKIDPKYQELLMSDKIRPEIAAGLVRAHGLYNPCFSLENMMSTGLESLRMLDEIDKDVESIQASSTLKKRRLKMNKHKYRKRRKRDRRRSK